tara:strand:- start:1933 stop:2136 length:204 start_codon:yes stop_codon:yes gene_type:complete
MDEIDGRYRSNVKFGNEVKIVQKQHQKTGELTQGTVKRILTKLQHHPHGIKVMLTDGKVGRVKNILS